MRNPPEPTHEGSCLDALKALPPHPMYHTIDQIRFKIAELAKLDRMNAPPYDVIFRALNNLVETQQLDCQEKPTYTFSYRWRKHPT